MVTLTRRPLLGMLGLAMLGRPARAGGALTVFAAASLTDALGEIGRLWEEAGHAKPRFSFAASSTLARQIAAGAPADLFASADERWMDELAARGLIAPDTRRDLLGNRLVLIVPRDRAMRVAIRPGFDLAALLGKDGRLAVGGQGVPAGIYAEQALRRLGLWPSVANRLAPAEDVRAALLLVERGAAPAGIVYATDAAAAPGVAVAGTFPAASHDGIRYPFALTRAGDTAEGRALLRFLAGPQARAVFTRAGFTWEGDDPRGG